MHRVQKQTVIDNMNVQSLSFSLQRSVRLPVSRIVYTYTSALSFFSVSHPTFTFYSLSFSVSLHMSYACHFSSSTVFFFSSHVGTAVDGDQVTGGAGTSSVLCWHTCVLAVWLPFTQYFTTGCCAPWFFLCLIQCACKCVSLAAALWDWAIGTRPLFRWLGNPVSSDRTIE